MKYLSFLYALTALLWSNNLCAFDYAFKNNDGVTIYYNSYWPNIYNAEVTYSGYNKYSGIVNIPQKTENNMSVIAIGKKAFYECTGLTNVSIPNLVNYIYDYSFYGCTGLESIKIPNEVSEIGNYAFAGCTGLTSINIPNRVSLICSHAFEGCTGLKSVIIANVEAPLSNNIGSYAFAGCTELISISFPNSIRSISEHCFEGCIGLSSITIPNRVENIGEFAFYNCNLNSITISNSVTYIGANAFDGENSPIIQTIISLIEKPFRISGKTSGNGQKYMGTFSEETFNKAILYVPKGCLDKYKKTDGWKDFAHIEEFDASGINTTTSDCDISTRYELNGNKITTHRKGIYIIKKKDGTTKKVIVK